MPVLPLFQIDAFTTHFLEGNPAAVVLLKDGWMSDLTMQRIARKNNLSETAFVDLSGEGETLGLRWFTPTVEMDLCGHATLAAAFVLFREELLEGDKVVFSTRSGDLHVTRNEHRIQLDFPSRPPKATSSFPALEEALGGVTPQEVHSSERDLLVILENEEAVRMVRPDFEKLATLDAFAVIVSARGQQVDFVSRFFAPNAGVPEDPVTGSAHCTLVPYWSKLLRQPRLRARQLSERGGELFCEDCGERVKIAGEAVEYLRGTIQVEDE